MRNLVGCVVVSACSALAGADVLIAAQDLGVRHLSLQELAPVQDRQGDRVMLSVELDGRPVVLDLAPKSYRSEDFRLVLDFGNGNQVDIPAPPPRTYRGTIAGDPTSVVAGSLIDGAAHLMILTDEGTWTVQPWQAEGGVAGGAVHAVYNQRDVLEHGGTCITPDAADAGLGALPMPMEAPTFGLRGSGDFRIAEIALDADYQLYNNFFNRNETALLNDVDSVMAGLSAIYERDVLLTYQVTQVLIRATLAANPYTTNDASTLLSQFAAEWNANQTAVQRDVAHLWTGRNLSGSTIGIAFLGTICTSSAYGVDQIRFTTNFNSRVGLFSHELGHNWNAPHCDGAGECRIMCSGLGGCNGLGNPVRFAPVSIGTMNTFIANRPCVDNTGTSLPLFEDFEDQSIDPPAWAGAAGFNIVFDSGAPSGVRVGEFVPQFTSLSTNPIEAVAAPGETVVVSAFLEPQGAGAGDMRISIRDADNVSRRLATIPAHDLSAGYVEYAVQLPGWAIGLDTPVTFAPAGSVAWRIDDVRVETASSTDAVLALPLVEDFERSGLFMDRWQPSRGAVDNAEASGGLYSLALDAGQRLESADALGASGDGIVFGALVRSPAAPAGDAELVIEYRNASGQWIEVARRSAASVPSGEYGLVEVVLPAGAEHNQLSVAFEIVGGASDEPWRIDDLELGGEPRGGSPCPADVAEPFGVLDLNDIGAFVAAFTGGDPLADLAEPLGVLDLGDVSAFTSSFVAGCP